jgi:cytoskeletal protein CcmA (bactofilin family)
MWKKDEMSPGAEPTPGAAPTKEGSKPSATPSERATIGRSITVKGEVTGDEDLLIQGTVDGSVDLEQHSVVVGREGRVHADVKGRVITVEGEVEGNLLAKEQIILRSSARVEGDIKAPRVVLDDGANFRGLVDMGPPPKDQKTAGSTVAGTARETSGSNGMPDTPSPKAGSDGTPSPPAKVTAAKDKDEAGRVGKATP